jgi:phosphoglycolate phosphatase
LLDPFKGILFLMQSQFDAIFFDLDGTLIDSAEDIAAAANHVRCYYQMPELPVSTVATYVGDGVRMLLSRTLATEDSATLTRAVEVWWNYYRVHGLDKTKLYPGVNEMLQQLKRANVPLSIVTNKPHAATELVLKGLNIRDLFEVVVGGDTIVQRKPDPEPLRFAAKSMNKVPQRILMVGDGPHDIQSAKNAGYDSCAVLWGFTPEQLIRELNPTYVCSHPSEICQVAGF